MVVQQTEWYLSAPDTMHKNVEAPWVQSYTHKSPCAFRNPAAPGCPTIGFTARLPPTPARLCRSNASNNMPHQAALLSAREGCSAAGLIWPRSRLRRHRRRLLLLCRDRGFEKIE
jgi:hypothetical protein